MAYLDSDKFIKYLEDHWSTKLYLKITIRDLIDLVKSFPKVGEENANGQD